QRRRARVGGSSGKLDEAVRAGEVCPLAAGAPRPRQGEAIGRKLGVLCQCKLFSSVARPVAGGLRCSGVRRRSPTLGWVWREPAQLAGKWSEQTARGVGANVPRSAIR